MEGRIERSDEKWVLLATILASSMAFIDSSALNVTLPRIQADVGITGGGVFWVVNAYGLTLAALILVGGVLGDRYGRKRVFAFGIALFTAASIVCGLSTSGGMLIAARAVQGVGGALMTPGSLALIAALFPDERRGVAIGTWSTFSTLTTILGPVLGGWLAEQGLWRMIFFINVPLAAIALFVLVTRVPESRERQDGARLDLAGATLATLGLAGLSYGLLQLGESGSGDPLVIAALVVGVLASVAFVILELRIAHPMLPPSLFKSRTFSGANLLTLFLYGALGGFLVFLPLNVIQAQGYSSSEAGFVFLPFAIILTLLSRQAGRMVDRIGARPMLIVGPAITGLGFAAMALPGLTNGAADYWISYFPGVVLMGIGMGITVAPLTTAVMTSAPRDSAGVASGVNNAVARTAGVLAVAVFGALALGLFASSLNARTAEFPLSDEARAALSAEAQNLGGAQPPADLAEPLRAQIETAIRWSFVDTFRLAAVLAAVLAFLSAGAAAVLVEPKKQTLGDPSGPDAPQPQQERERFPEADDSVSGMATSARQRILFWTGWSCMQKTKPPALCEEGRRRKV
ncbi:MAG: MFS transporter [Chloroflexi bacterium]|nr:MFS transporter [Chloroflexota bacterium]